MKKSLTAAAVLGAFAGSVAAAQVQLYGILDTGFAYVHSDMDVTRDGLGVDATDSFSMESGMQSASRFGFKGTEELGNGLTVGFVLENQFSGDTGAVSDNDHFFRREASGEVMPATPIIFLATPAFGTMRLLMKRPLLQASKCSHSMAWAIRLTMAKVV